jgi:hypothetical protein
LVVSADQTRVDELVAHPSEALNVEIKGWIDPKASEGIAKIARAALAIRNRGGGFLIIGFDDATLLPDEHGRPSDVRSVFHHDIIQGIVSRYASDKFEIAIAYGRRDGSEYPVIIIPEGVSVPVACARDLFDQQNRLLREGEVYFRTLNANGTPSTAAARSGDWTDIIEICFENREADIGRFLRRHLSGANLPALTALLAELSEARAPETPTLRQRTGALLDNGEARFQAALAARQSVPNEPDLRRLGSWSVALVIDPSRETALPDADFWNRVASSNPRYTGWPVWLDSRSFTDRSARPRVIERAWQAFIVSLRTGETGHVDFIRLDPRGEFYLRRILQDDLNIKVAPGTALDAVLTMIRTAEVIAVGLALTRGLGWAPETTTLAFGFRWVGLRGRELASWASLQAYISPGRTAYDDEVGSYVEVPLDTAPSAVAPYVEQALRDLFIVFDGFTMPSESVEQWVQRLVTRRL